MKIRKNEIEIEIELRGQVSAFTIHQPNNYELPDSIFWVAEERLLRLRRPFMQGQDVHTVQDVLLLKGVNVEVDGVFGPATRDAVIAMPRTQNRVCSCRSGSVQEAFDQAVKPTSITVLAVGSAERQLCSKSAQLCPCWLPFVDTYRTMCRTPKPEFKRVLEDVRHMRLAA